MHHAIAPRAYRCQLNIRPLFSKRVWHSAHILSKGAILAVGPRTVAAALFLDVVTSTGLQGQHGMVVFSPVKRRGGCLAAGVCKLECIEKFVRGTVTVTE